MNGYFFVPLVPVYIYMSFVYKCDAFIMYIFGDKELLLQYASYFLLLTGLRPSVKFSNILGVGVPTLISRHIAVRIIHYRIFINTRLLFLLHLQLFRPPPLITKPYSLMLPPAYGSWRSWPPLLHNNKVKDWPHGNVLCHTGVASGDIIPNHLHTCFR